MRTPSRQRQDDGGVKHGDLNTSVPRCLLDFHHCGDNLGHHIERRVLTRDAA
jgi:hypothetical protein